MAVSADCPIKTIVLLVQENRSFDHMLGWMKTLNPEIDGVDHSDEFYNPVSTSDLNSSQILFRPNSAHVDPDPDHTFQAIYEQVFGEQWSEESAAKKLPPTMKGFALNAERKQKGLSETVMNGLKPEMVPVYKELVSEFGVCDRWFASVPTLTQPNRLYVHSASSYGMVGNERKMLIEGFPQKTIFESLDEEDLSFGIYYQYPASTLFYRNLRKLKYINNFHQFDVHFKRHCKEGKLPNYVVIEQRYFDTKLLAGNDDHPSHDVSEGQKFVKEIYESLRSSPQWNEILFLIIYDEHGGFFDHVPTPVDGVPSPDDVDSPAPYNFKFDRLGVRVPAIFISPWIERGSVLHGAEGPYPTSQYEHSSIAATVKKIFNLKAFLNKRDAWAGTFDCILNRNTPRTDCPETLPEPVRMREAEAKEDEQLSEFQQELLYLAATLNGDHRKKHMDLQKLAANIPVSEAVKYSEEALKKFLDECEKARENGADESHIVVYKEEDEDEEKEEDEEEEEVQINGAGPPPRKSFAQKLFSCLICDH